MAVSYTHLDVYKRQLLERATTDGQTQIDIEMPETEVVLLDVQSTDGLRWIKKLQR